MRLVVAGFLVAFVVVACSSGGGTGATASPSATLAGPTSGPVSSLAPGELPTAAQLCALLSADDWSQFGYVTADSPTINSDEPGTAYCAYAGSSGGSGGLEFDAFVAATEEDAQATFETIISEGLAWTPVDAANADAVAMGTGDEYAAIAVRDGRFTFTIAVPPTDDAENQLMTLANTVVTRSEAYR